MREKAGQTLFLGGGLQFNQSLGNLSETDVGRAQRAIMGEAGYARYKEYGRTDGARAVVGDAALALNFSETPLTSGQANGLVQIVAQASPDFLQGKAVAADAINWDAVLQQASSLLSNPQLAVLQSLRDRQSAGTQLSNYEQAAAARQQNSSMRASRLYRSATFGLIGVGLAVAWHARLARRKADYAAGALSQLQATTESIASRGNATTSVGAPPRRIPSGRAAAVRRRLTPGGASSETAERSPMAAG